MDAATLEALYKKYYRKLLVYGSTVTFQSDLVQDTVQEIFADLWQRKDRQNRIRNVEVYLFVSLRNNLRRKLKEENNRDLQPLSAETTDEVLPAQEEEWPFPPHLEHLIGEQIRRLPNRQQEVIYLRYYMEMSYKEIAEVMNIQVQVARNFAYRALRQLKLHFKHSGDMDF